MATELATAYISLVPSARGITGRIEKELAGPVATVGEKQGGRLGQMLMSGVKKVGLGAAVTVGTALTTALVKGWGRLTAIDDAQAKLRGLGYTAGEIETIMDSALSSVKGTAFGLGDAATAAASALASGVKPGQELERYLRLIGDAATQGGASFTEMASIINKTTARGKVGMENLNQLSERGIGIMGWLADEYGVTGEELAKMVSRGEVDLATFQRVLEENIGGAAQESGKTVRGAMANVSAALSRVGASLLSGVFPKIAPMLTGLIGVLDQIAPVATRVGEAVGVWLGGAFDRLAQIDMSGVAASIGGLVTQGRDLLDGVLARLAEIDAAAWFGILADVMGRLADVMGRLAPIVAGALVAGFLAFVDVVKEAANFLAPVAAVVAGALLTGLEGVASATEWVARNWGTLKPILLGVGAVIATVLIPHWIRLGVQATIASAKNVAAWVAGRKAAATSAAAQVKQSYQVIAAWGRQAAAAVKSGATTARIWLMYKAESAKAAAAVVAAKAKMIAQWVRHAAIATVNAAKVAAAWLIAMGPIAVVIAAVVGLVAAIIIHWDTIKNAIATAAQWVWDRMKAIWGGIRDTVVNVVTGVHDRAVAIWNGLRDAVVGSVTALRDRISGVWNSVRTKAYEIWDGIRSKVQGVIDFFTGVPGELKRAGQGMWDWLWDAFRGIVNKVIDGWNSLEFKLPSFDGMKVAGRTIIPGWEGPTLGVPKIPRLAQGGIVQATPGGILANIGEGRWDEAVIPLSPKVLSALRGTQDRPTQNIEHVTIVSSEPARALYDETLWRLSG